MQGLLSEMSVKIIQPTSDVFESWDSDHNW